MHGKTYYKNIGLAHFVAMLLFIAVFYIGIIMNHWLTFDVGLFGAIIGCISTVYNVTQYENVKIIEKQLGYTMEEIIAMEKAEKMEAAKELEENDEGYEEEAFEEVFEV